MGHDWIDLYNTKKRSISKIVDKTGIKRHRYSVHKRWGTVYTPDDITKYVREHNIKTLRQLEKAYHQGDETAPPRSQVNRYFGGWNMLKEKVWGIVRPTFTNDEIVKLCLQFNITNRKQYIALRRDSLRLLPHAKTIILRFGSWKHLIRLVMANKYESIFERFILLYHELGRFPNKQQCEKHGVEYNRLFKVISRDEMKIFIKFLKKNKYVLGDVNEKQN